MWRLHIPFPSWILLIISPSLAATVPESHCLHDCPKPWVGLPWWTDAQDFEQVSQMLWVLPGPVSHKVSCLWRGLLGILLLHNVLHFCSGVRTSTIYADLSSLCIAGSTDFIVWMNCSASLGRTSTVAPVEVEFMIATSGHFEYASAMIKNMIHKWSWRVNVNVLPEMTSTFPWA